MKKLLFFVFVLSLTACQDKYKSNLHQMEVNAKLNIEDASFKENTSVKFMEFKAISYDTISENVLDDMRTIKLSSIYDKYKSILDLQKELIDNEVETFKNYKSLGWDDLANTSKKKIDKSIAECRCYTDSLILVANQISAIDSLMKNRTNSKEYYRCKIYAKATFTDNSDKSQSYNLMDTISVLFEPNLNIITP